MRTAICSLVVAALLGAGCGDDGAGVAEPGEPADDASETVDDGSGSSDADDTETSESTSSTAPDNADTDPDRASADSEPASTTSTSSTTTVLVAPDAETTNTTPSTTLPATAGIPEEGERFNEGGVPITLDETGALACANAEFARDSIGFDNLDQAERDLNAAADRAEPSEQPDIAAAADLIRGALDAVDPLSTVAEFLDICVEHGHQI